jgi:hypothetical protein
VCCSPCVSFIACATLCAVFIERGVILRNVYFCVMCLIVIPLPPVRTPFAVQLNYNNKTKLHGLSPRANYTGRATAACRRS